MERSHPPTSMVDNLIVGFYEFLGTLILTNSIVLTVMTARTSAWGIVLALYAGI